MTPLVLLSAFLAALALPPWGVYWLAWVALVPFFVVLRRLSVRRAIAAGLLWGVAHHWATAYWVLPAMANYYEQPWWFAVTFGIVSSVIFRGTYGAVFAVVANRAGLNTGPFLRPWLVASTWTAVEFVRSRWLTEDPWLLLGYALLPCERLIQVADLTGVYGLSFLVAFVNAALAELVVGAWVRSSSTWAGVRPPPLLGELSINTNRVLRDGPKGGGLLRTNGKTALISIYQPLALRSRPLLAASRRGRRMLPPALTAGALVAAASAYGAYRLSAPLPSHPPVSVTVVQGNNNLGAQWRPELHGRSLRDYVRLSLASTVHQRSDVFVWPESAVTLFVAHEPAFRERMAQLVRQTGTELIVGAPHYDEATGQSQFFNSAFHMSANGELNGRYDKMHLLPFAEYFPLRFGAFLRRNFGRVRSFTPGAQTTVLETRLGKTAIAICFEAIFPDLVRRRMAAGAEVLVNLSNDAWLGAGAGPQQHFAMVVLRAVENRTWVIRSTTTGVSALIDPWGRVHRKAPMAAEAVLTDAIVPLRVETLYERWGDWFGFLCCVATVVAMLFSLRRGGQVA